MRYKARLVAKGYSQRPGYDYKESYATVAIAVTIRTLLAIINKKNMYYIQLDVKTAFLYGDRGGDIHGSSRWVKGRQ